jgi:RNA polymerase subunit RPABC4/transcription elongation factor Spt4
MMVLDTGLLQTILTYLTAVFGAFVAGLWISLVFWTYRDIRARTQDRMIHILAALLVAVLSLPGVVIYLILRPARTIDETYQHTLEEEALLSEVESRQACPACGTMTQADWQLCPTCHTKLRKPCGNCGRLMELPWRICPYCGTPAPGMRQPAEAPEIDLIAGEEGF